MIDICLDLFIAGADTSSNTLSFAILYMVLNPKVQTKVQEEIDSVLGRERSPTSSDMQRFEYIFITFIIIYQPNVGICSV